MNFTKTQTIPLLIEVAEIRVNLRLTASFVAKNVMQMCMLLPAGWVTWMRIETRKPGENETANMLPPQKKEKSLLTFFSQNTIQQNAPWVASPPPVHAAPILPETIRDPRGVMPVSDCQGAVVTACSEFVPRNWTCPSCKSNSTKRRR